MKILTYPLGQLQANCYFLIKDQDCLIIDPADDASFILEELQRRRLKLIGMLATHGHFDHLMAAGEIQKSIPTPFYINKNDIFLLDRLEETAKYFLSYDPVIIKLTTINQLIGVRYTIGNFSFEIIKSPGHTPGSNSYFFKNEAVIFTGDTLFKNGIGRYDFSYSNKGKLKKSLEILLKLSVATVVYPGHGDPTTIGNEKDIPELYPLSGSA